MNISVVKNLAKKVLKKAGLREPRNGQKKRVRNDVEIIPIQAGLKFEVYWKILKIGKGPALILKSRGKEVMKFDCFGKDKGHYHVAPHYNFRIFFPEEKAIDQIKRTSLELRNNAQKYIALQTDERIKQIKIDKDKFDIAVQEAEEKMIYFLQTVPEFEELR